jgi:hypothetical protein
LNGESRSIAHPAGPGVSGTGFPLTRVRAIWRAQVVSRRRAARRLENCAQFFMSWFWQLLFLGTSFAVRFGRFKMSIFSYRKHLRFLTPAQRRRWWDQKKRLKPRVHISGAYVPPNVSREFTYVKVG